MKTFQFTKVYLQTLTGVYVVIMVLVASCGVNNRERPLSQIANPVKRFNALRMKLLDKEVMKQNESAKEQWRELKLGKAEPRPVFRSEHERASWERRNANQELFDAYQEKEEFEQWRKKLKFFSKVVLTEKEAEAFWTRYNRSPVESTDWELVADIVMQIRFNRQP